MNRSIDGVVSAGDTRPRLLGNPISRSNTKEIIRRDPKTNGRRAIREHSIKKQGHKPGNEAPKSWKERLQLPIIVIGGMLSGLAVQNALLGQLLIIGYGIAALIYKVPSRTTFIVALAAMLIMLGSLIFRGDVQTSQTFAVYSFLLLVVGVITLNREVKREGGRVYSRR